MNWVFRHGFDCLRKNSTFFSAPGVCTREAAPKKRRGGNGGCRWVSRKDVTGWRDVGLPRSYFESLSTSGPTTRGMDSPRLLGGRLFSGAGMTYKDAGERLRSGEGTHEGHLRGTG